MNFSAILINVALRAAERAQRQDRYATLAIYTAVVFAVMAIEALLNEQAYIQVHQRGVRSLTVYTAVENGAQGFDRVQAILLFLFGRALQDGQNPANDLKLLLQIRNGLTHYRFERPPTKALDQLAQHGRFSEDWKRASASISWPAFVASPLATWAYETACHAACSIADIIEAAGDPIEADLVRGNFDPHEISRLLRRSDLSANADS